MASTPSRILSGRDPLRYVLQWTMRKRSQTTAWHELDFYPSYLSDLQLSLRLKLIQASCYLATALLLFPKGSQAMIRRMLQLVGIFW